MGKLLILLVVGIVIVVDFISYINNPNREVIDEFDHGLNPEMEEKLFRFYQEKGWSNIGYDKGYNLIGNHPEYGNGELILSYY